MATAANRSSGPASSSAQGERVDVRRYFAALRRDRWLVAGIVAVITGAVLALSLVLPKTYGASTTIVLVDTGSSVFGEPDPVAVQRRLATLETVLTSTQVLSRAAGELGEGETDDTVEESIATAVDPEANLIEVSASADSPERAAAIANTVTSIFLDVQGDLEVAGLREAERGLESQLEALQADPSATSEEIGAINERLNDLRVQIGAAGSDLQLAEEAMPPDEQASPRPLRNTVLAFFAALFLGVLVALARDQLRPGISEPRELSRMFGRPVLSAIPYLARRRKRSRHAVTAVEHEAYQNLRAAVQIAMPPAEGSACVLLVTSAVHAEGKTTVTARLGRALAQAGHRTLLISADLRWPNLHTLFNLPLAPGLTEVLGMIERSGMNDYVLPATVHPIPVGGGPDSELDVLTSGTKPTDPARLLAGEAMRTLVDRATELGYSYVLIDAPPMLGIADVQGMAQLADRMVLVTRLDRITIEHVLDMQELVDRLALDLLGLVVIGAKVDVSPYYLSERPAIIAGEGERSRAAG